MPEPRRDARAPRPPRARARLAALEVGRGDYEAALPELRRWVEAQPGESAPLLYLASALVELEEWTEAAEALDRALQVEPQSAALHRRRGDLCRRLGEKARAADHFASALQLDPDDDETRLKHALLLADLARVDEALAELSEVIRRDSEHAAALYQRGLLRYTEKGDLAGALADLEHALAIDPDDAMVKMIHQELLLERAATAGNGAPA